MDTLGRLQYWSFSDGSKLLHTVEQEMAEKLSKISITSSYSAHNDPNSGVTRSGEDPCLNTLDINCAKDRVAVGGN